MFVVTNMNDHFATKCARRDEKLQETNRTFFRPFIVELLRFLLITLFRLPDVKGTPMNQPVSIFYSDDFVVDGAFDTIGKAHELAKLLNESPITGTIMVSPSPANRGDIVSVHDEHYVDEVLNGHGGQFSGDDESATSVLASTGGVLRAVETVLENGGCAGSLSSGLHHAKHDRGSGYCTFNGLVIGARRALSLGAKRVLILDLDAHCGGGTKELIGLLRDQTIDGIEQVDVSVSSFDQYHNSSFAQLKIVGASEYLDTIKNSLAEIADPQSIDLVIYNAGMDPHEKAGGVTGITDRVIRQREAMVFEWAKSHALPIIWVLAGGYSGGSFTKRDVARLHRITVEESARVYAEVATI
jgi:acetoin utilization deacetylase AcuC-like enzyme